MTTLSDLIVAKTKDAQLDALLALLSGAGFPVTAWQSGNVGRTLAEAHSQVLSDLSAAVALIAKGGFLDEANGAWLTLLAAQRYNCTRNPAIATDGPVTLVAASGAGPFTITASQLTISDGGALRFRNAAGGTLDASGAVALEFKAESPGAAWNVANGVLASLLTSLAGVTISNYFDAVVHTGSATGSVTPAPVPSEVPEAGVDFVIKITVGGARGTGKFQYSLDGGSTYNGSDITIPSLGWYTALLHPGPSSTHVRPYFTAATYVLNDTFAWSSGTWIETSGTDAESNDALRQRCRDKLPESGTGATAAVYDAWAREASAQVTGTYVAHDSGTGEVDIWIRGSSGALAGGVITAVQDYINLRQPLCVQADVASVTSHTITVTGTLYVRAAFSSTALAAAGEALDALARAAATGGDPLGGGPKGVARATIIEKLMEVAGVVNVSLSAPSGDTTLTVSQVPAFDYSGLSVSVV